MPGESVRLAARLQWMRRIRICRFIISVKRIRQMSKTRDAETKMSDNPAPKAFQQRETVPSLKCVKREVVGIG